jgi:penicillin-binding protein 2
MKWKDSDELVRWKRRPRRRQRKDADSRLNHGEKRSHLMRVNVIYGMVFLSFTGLILRLGYVQIVKGTWFREQAQTTSLNKVPVLPARGWIYDTNGNLIAYDKPSYSVFLTRLPHVHQDYAAIAQALAPHFKVTAKSIMDVIDKNKAYATTTLFKNITPDELAYVEENQSQFPGVSVEIGSQRYYPYGDLAGHVLGYVGPISGSDTAYYANKNYLTNIQSVGLNGIEKQYEAELQGTVGQQVLLVNSRGTSTQRLGFDPPQQSGQSLQLTLDAHLQAVAQQSVMDTIQKSPYGSEIHNVGAVMLDVKNGGVLSLVSYPYYDANWYMNGDFLKHENYLKSSGAQINNAMQDPNYPGSTVKPANLIAGLNAGVVTPSTIFQDQPTTRIATDIRHDDAYHGTLTPALAITESCDTFFYRVGLMLGKWYGSTESNPGHWPGGMSLQTWLNTDLVKGMNAMFHTEWTFGLGQLTGIDLPYEQAGNFFIEKDGNEVPYDLQKSEQSIQKTGQYPTRSNPVDLAFAGIGQSQQFTPMELAQYVMTIADNGKKLQPHLLQAFYPAGMQHQLSSDDKPTSVFKPVVQDQLKLNSQYLQIVKQGMWGVCNNPAGTAYAQFAGASNPPPYQAAGKTGTAQIALDGKIQYNSVFIAYAPADNPQVAVAVMAPGGGYGAETSATIARSMIDTYFKEHHEFFPQNQWEDTNVPANWTKWSAYTAPEQSH